MYRNDLAHKKAAASSRCNRDDKQRAAAGNTDLRCAQWSDIAIDRRDSRGKPNDLRREHTAWAQRIHADGCGLLHHELADVAMNFGS
jgi:hypothetical protein